MTRKTATDVRVQRLQDITKEDCMAEGMSVFGSSKLDYEKLWNNINGTHAWDMNPWVWAYTFKKL